MKYLNTEHVIYRMSKDNLPVCSVKGGDTITIKTYDCFKNRLLPKDSTLDALLFEELNPATGPVYVEGAGPGDTLAVEILKIDLDSMGVTEIDPDFGCLADLVDMPYIKRLPVADNKIRFSSRLQLDVKPMIGVMGVAPEGDFVSTDTPGAHGGNMDCTEITEGSMVLFPVFTHGALLSLGDLHACMGDGEIGGCGLEIAGEVTLRISVLKGSQKPYPVVLTSSQAIVLASEKTVELAWRQASVNLYNFLTEESQMTSEEAIMLLSLAGNLAICQTVNPKKTVRMSFPLKYLEAYGYTSPKGN